ncbi:MAG TPA: hypothetical protein VFC84_19820 [Desulfosporosinus sp.]|nr:hypothetical protein [Desulfosporosinus sp.]
MTKSKSKVTKKNAENKVKSSNEAPSVPNVGDKMFRRTLPDDSSRIN